jgi:uncharacterized membrane protein
VTDDKQPVTGRTRNVVLALNKFVVWFARNWAAVLAVIFGVFAAGPWAAPMAMNAGLTRVGEGLYTVYAPMCHQFAFRSWFIYGEQPAYPRDRADTSLESFESAAQDEPFFDSVDVDVLDNDLVVAARAFRGSDDFGYKTAICQRDIGIYTALAAFAIFFAAAQALKLKVPYLPFWAYVAIAIVPIGLDGFSQLFANPPFNGFGLDWYPIRESTPFLRTFTGALFGFGNGWLAFPYIDDSMKESGELARQKLIKTGEWSQEEAPPPFLPDADQS